MNKKNIYRLMLIATLPLFTGCDDLFDPAIENQRDIEAMWAEPTYAEGFLANAYVLLPYQGSPSTDLATDDAVSNDQANNYLRMATGSWAADNDPTSQWQNRFNAIQYVNIFLENCDKVVWSNDQLLRTLFNDQFKGQAFAMRALQQYYLLRAHAGYTDDGQLLGFPLHLSSEGSGSDFNQPRATFRECYDQIMVDIDSALARLPLQYGDVPSTDNVPAKYTSIGATMGEYNRAFGSHFFGLMSGKAVEALRAQVALLAASDAYNAGSGVKWEDAANAAAIVLDRIGGINGMDPTGWKWFDNTSAIDNMKATEQPDEVIWRGSKASSSSMESDNFPPSIYGKGRVNPTENLVETFPMVNGYPITDAQSAYSATTPYDNRDPRLAAYIIYDGQKMGSSSAVITTGTYGTNRDALNRESGVSTRTGYYLRKLLRRDVNLTPSSTTSQNHFQAYMRYTEIFLDYAEAANEAWGPEGKGSHAYSAYDVIKALRSRAGVGIGNGDAYLESIKGDKEKMRQLIRNERRIELCFENQRFYDLRRWKVSLDKLNEPAKGLQIDKDAEGVLHYTVLPKVETRDYKDYMYFGPIPYSEVIKWSQLQQNKGW